MLLLSIRGSLVRGERGAAALPALTRRRPRLSRLADSAVASKRLADSRRDPRPLAEDQIGAAKLTIARCVPPTQSPNLGRRLTGSPRLLSRSRPRRPGYRNGDQTQPGPGRLLARRRLAPRPHGPAVGRPSARPLRDPSRGESDRRRGGAAAVSVSIHPGRFRDRPERPPAFPARHATMVSSPLSTESSEHRVGRCRRYCKSVQLISCPNQRHPDDPGFQHKSSRSYVAPFALHRYPSPDPKPRIAPIIGPKREPHNAQDDRRTSGCRSILGRGRFSVGCYSDSHVDTRGTHATAFAGSGTPDCR